MINHLNNIKSRKFYCRIDKFIYNTTQRVKESNVSVLKWFFAFLLFLIIIYIGLYFQSKYIPLNWSLKFWSPDVALPAILTATGLFFTIIVLFTIAPKKTQTGDQFLYLLIDEIDSLRMNDEITIISPNINIGTTTYPALLESLIKSITCAKLRNAKIYFLSLSLNKLYLDKFQKDDKISTYSSFYLNGVKNDCEMLTYLGELYDKKELSKQEYEKTIDILKQLHGMVEIITPKTPIISQRIVGFLSNTKFYTGKFLPDSRNDKHITVKGEIINTPETVEMLKKHFIKDL